MFLLGNKNVSLILLFSSFSPICNIEVPKRLSSCYEHLKRYNLAERCLSVPAREGTEDEIMSVHRSAVNCSLPLCVRNTIEKVTNQTVTQEALNV